MVATNNLTEGLHDEILLLSPLNGLKQNSLTHRLTYTENVQGKYFGNNTQ